MHTWKAASDVRVAGVVPAIAQRFSYPSPTTVLLSMQKHWQPIF